MTGGRATQLRARFPLAFGSQMRVIWLVTNASLPLVDLADDADAELQTQLREQHVHADGLCRWHEAHGDDGSLWLVVDVAVRPND
jgi:hypothetical protein